MKTYKITATTNGYIASRDIHFNGRTSYDVVTGLSYEKALEKLEDFFRDDYDSAYFYENEDEFIKYMLYVKIEEHAISANENIDEYFQKTKKRWTSYFKLINNKRAWFEGAGYYSREYWGCIFKKGKETYEFDSRYYTVFEEENE